MGFLSYWPLALLVLVPVIILLYILRQETKPKEFSSSMLWNEVIRNMEATKPWEKLRRNILLFLQIITVILFVVTMMHPWLKGLGANDKQAVIVIDNSASMGTLYDGKQTRLEAAKEAACAYINDLSSNAVIYVISGNRQAVLELANSNDKIEAKNKIAAIKQTSFSGDMSVSLGLVESCINQAANPEVIFFTDTEFDTGDITASIDSFYNEAVNVSMDSVSYAYRDDKLLVLTQLSNYSEEKLSREINLYGVMSNGKEQLLDIVSADVDGKSSDSVYFELDSQAASDMVALHAEINDEDALKADNSSWCVLSEVGEKNVLLYTETNMFIEKAMAGMPSVSVYRTSEKEIFEKENNYDLYIFDGMVPEKLPERGSMLFINCQDVADVVAGETVESTRLSFDNCELSAYIADTKIGVNKSYVYNVPSWGSSFIKAKASENSAGDAAGFYGIQNGQKIVAIGFDLHQTDFGLQAEFPILVSNMTDYLLEGSLVEQSSYTAGDSVMLHGNIKGSNLAITDPDGDKTSISAVDAAGSYMQISMPGIYTVAQEVNGEKTSAFFASQFPFQDESDVSSASNTITSNTNITAAEIKTGTVDLTNYILIILLILMVAEWIVYVRLM